MKRCASIGEVMTELRDDAKYKNHIHNVACMVVEAKSLSLEEPLENHLPQVAAEGMCV